MRPIVGLVYAVHDSFGVIYAEKGLKFYQVYINEGLLSRDHPLRYWVGENCATAVDH